MDTQTDQDSSRPQPVRRNVLIVEDEPLAREATALYLRSRGYDTATASNGMTALEEAEVSKPDVLVCDWRLAEGESGVDVAGELQTLYGVAIIFTTAYPIDDLRDITGNLVVTEYFKKPVSLPILADTVANIAS